MPALLRWAGQLFLLLVGGYFLLFGIQLLVAAYRLNNPFWFIMTFFSANLIILISAVLLIAFFLRLFTAMRAEKDGRG